MRFKSFIDIFCVLCFAFITSIFHVILETESNAISFSYKRTHLRAICTSRRIDKGLKFLDVDARINVNGFLKDFNKCLPYFSNIQQDINSFSLKVPLRSFQVL